MKARGYAVVETFGTLVLNRRDVRTKKEALREQAKLVRAYRQRGDLVQKTRLGTYLIGDGGYFTVQIIPQP